jgi:hypothetical protein
MASAGEAFGFGLGIAPSLGSGAATSLWPGTGARSGVGMALSGGGVPVSGLAKAFFDGASTGPDGTPPAGLPGACASSPITAAWGGSGQGHGRHWPAW